MADKSVTSLTSSTPTIDDLTISYDNADTSELKKTTWQLVRDLFKSYFDTIYASVSGGTFTGDISVPDEAYGAGWNGSLEVPTKNAVYDKIQTLGGGGDALTTNPLSQFASTTSLQLKGVISDETGSGSLVFATSPTLVTPTLGVATATSINGATITSGTLNGSVTGTNTGDQAIATTGEVDTGTDNTKIITPLALAGSSLSLNVMRGVASSVDSEIVLYSGTGGKLSKRATTTGILKGTSGVLSAATVRTDYAEPTTALATGILKNTTGTGAHTIATGGDLPVMTSTVGGAVPTPPNNTTTFLRGDGTFSTPSGSGDMVLASAQTNSGLKTFLDSTLGLRNVANTITSFFTNTATVARTWTLPDSNTIIPIISQLLTFSGPTASRTITLPDTSFTVARNDGLNITIASQAIGDIIIASSTTSINRLADVAVGSVLVSGGVGVAPSYSANPQVTTIELGHATDTTISRSSAGVIAVEGVVVPTISSTSTLTNKTLTTPTISKPVMSATNPTAQTYTPAAAGTATLDLSLSNQHDITMPAGNITIAISNDTNNQLFVVTTTQDATGSRTVTWFTTIKWAGGVAPTLTTTASKRDMFGFKRTGSGTYDGFIIAQNI